MQVNHDLSRDAVDALQRATPNLNVEDHPGAETDSSSSDAEMADAEMA